MNLTILTGGIGSGKSEYVENLIKKSIFAKRKALVIVPERFSHIEERTLSEHLGGLGLNGVEVSTFTLLSSKLSVKNEYLMPSGREMLILKSAIKCQKEGDGIFEGAYERNGFINGVSNAVLEFKHSLLTPEMLKSYQGGGLLQQKMSALAAIYSEYNSLVENKYSEPSENMSLLSQNIDESEIFGNTDVYIDGFTDFMEAHYKVIESIIKKAASVTVTLTVTANALKTREGIFTPVLASFSKLKELADRLGASINIKHQEGEFTHIKSEDIRYFLKNYDEYQDLSEPPCCNNITAMSFKNRHSEVIYVANRIMEEVRKRNLRFRDIGVLLSNSDAYLHIIDSVFSGYKIPYSADKKMLATEHPVIRLVLSAFKVITENWSYSSVFEYLHSGFIYTKKNGKIVPYSRHKIDKLELYVKTRGIKGKNMWLSEEEWKASKERIFDEATGAREKYVDIDSINKTRNELMKPFAVFLEKIKGKQRVSELSKAIYEFLEDIYLFEGLELEKKRFETANMLDEAFRIATVWEIIIETLDQAVMTCGGEYMSRDNFYHMLEAGFSKCNVDIIPSGVDRVSVSGIETNRPVRVKTLFVLGATYNELPGEQKELGILTATDRNTLLDAGIEGLPNQNTKKELAEFNLYLSLTAGCERLCFTMPEYNDEGSKNTPATPLHELFRFFGRKALIKPIDEWEGVFSSKRSAYNKLASRLGADISDSEAKFWEYMWDSIVKNEQEYKANSSFMLNDDFSVFDSIEAKRLDMISKIKEDKLSKSFIRPETAKLLYGERTFSISALQRFNKCPFSYFADYGLGLKNDEERTVKASDIGSMVHWAVCEYCQMVQKDSRTDDEKRQRWSTLTNDESDLIIKELTQNIAEVTKAANPDFTPQRIEVICEKAAKALKRSAKIIRLSLTEGDFCAYDFEKPFKFTLKNNKGSVELFGIIDRTDIAKTKSGNLVRVIDYKTGSQDFSVEGIYNKTDLQLMIYALAAEDMYKEENAKIGAVMYNKIKEDLNSTELGLGALANLTPLDGVIVYDDGANENEEILIHTKELSDDGVSSVFLPLATKKKGGLRKNNILIPRTKFDMLSRYTANTAIDTKNSIYSGRVGPYPLGEGEYSPCGFCEYSSLCMYDKLRDGIRTPITSSKKAWEKLSEEEKTDE